MKDVRDLEALLDARVPLLVIESREEAKVVALLERTANLNGRGFYTWNVTKGLRRHNGQGDASYTEALPEALRHIEKNPQDGIFLFLDAHPYLQDPLVVRSIKDIALRFDKMPRLLVFLSAKFELPDELAGFAARFRPSLPDTAQIHAIVKDEFAQWQGETGARVRGSMEALEVLLQHLAGIAEQEVRRLVRLAVRDDGAVTVADIGRVLHAKHEFVRASEVLTLEQGIPRFEELGGLGKLKRWLQVRREVFMKGAEGTGLPPPKGLLLLGVQGAGKSLAAKTVAGAWHLPLFRLDFGALYNKFHGETERNLRETLAAAAAMAPCVLWIDEIEKGIAIDAGGASDGGVSARVLGTLLTWMAERNERVFVVATANDIARLPPELLRKGRFDEIFFVDLPNAAARMEILRIHLARHKLDPAAFDLARLAAASAGFSGAEIEQAIVSALYEAHAAKAALSGALLEAEMGRSRPLSVLMAEKVQALRDWAASRAVPAD